jgi:hypothetical protein
MSPFGDSSLRHPSIQKPIFSLAGFTIKIEIAIYQ